MNETTKLRLKKVLAVLKFLLLIGIIAAIPLYITLAKPAWLELFESREALNAFLDEHQSQSWWILLGIQVVQIVISVIPGQVAQFAGGYALGLWGGYLVTIIGCIIGTIVAYYLAKLLGRDAVELFFSEEKTAEFLEKLNSKKAYAIIFILYLIPMVPKDMIVYVAGLSKFRLAPLMVISLLGRTPAMLAGILMGDLLRSENYISLIVLLVITGILLLLCVIYRKQLTDKADLLYDKLSGVGKRDGQ
ncbi:MAG: TVP38/TMEM64 family protein [Clostridiales bacterium]|nr:TVP38/TMEM64 family protein [Clostridiales bacterium]